MYFKSREKKKQWEQSDKSKQIAEKVLRKHLNVFNIVWLLTHFRLKSGLKIFAICLSICDIQIQTQCTSFPNLNCVQVLIRLKSIYFRSTLKSKFVLCHELKNGQPQKGKAKKKMFSVWQVATFLCPSQMGLECVSEFYRYEFLPMEKLDGFSAKKNCALVSCIDSDSI